MSILEKRFNQAYELPLVVGTSAVTGGRLVRIEAVSGNSSPKVKVVHASAATDYVLGAAEADAPIGGDVTVSTRGLLKLTANGAIPVNVDVVPGPNGTVVEATGAAGERPCGRSMSVAGAAGQAVWVFKYNR